MLRKKWEVAASAKSTATPCSVAHVGHAQTQLNCIVFLLLFQAWGIALHFVRYPFSRKLVNFFYKSTIIIFFRGHRLTTYPARKIIDNFFSPACKEVRIKRRLIRIIDLLKELKLGDVFLMSVSI